MDKPHLFPLERALEFKAQSKNECPDHRINYFDRYLSIVNFLRKDVYPNIDAGLAALSEENGFYTLHGEDHFDEVVKYAGELLGCHDKNIESFDLLNTYELFVLLVAIRIHDTGNMYGRERHEKRAFQFLQKMGVAINPDKNEDLFIADIARAHGGKTPSGSKDTIGQLQPKFSYGNVDIRSQLIAAIVRFADEICESRTRAALILLDDGMLKGKNEVYHKYASCITSVRVFQAESAKLNGHTGKGSPLEVSLQFSLDEEDCRRKWGKIEDGQYKEVYLIEEIVARLDKMSLEREYCVKFMREICNVVHIKASVKIFRDTEHEGIPLSTVIWEKIFISEPEGYPAAKSFVNNENKVTGESLIAELDTKGE